jgi:hypothetical protein
MSGPATRALTVRILEQTIMDYQDEEASRQYLESWLEGGAVDAEYVLRALAILVLEKGAA